MSIPTKRAFLELVASVVSVDEAADYGGMHYAAHWVLRRDVVAMPHRCGLGHALVRIERAAPGMPVRIEWPRPLASDLVRLEPTGHGSAIHPA